MTFAAAKTSSFSRIDSIDDLLSRDINGYFAALDADITNLFRMSNPVIQFGAGDTYQIIQYTTNNYYEPVSTIGGWTIGNNLLSAGTSGAFIGLQPVVGIWLGDEAFLSAPFSVDPAGVLTAHSGEIAGWTISATSLHGGSDLNMDYIALTPGVGIHMGYETFADAFFSVTKEGVLKAVSGTVGGWTLGTSKLSAGTGSTYMSFDTANGMWLGAETQGAAPFSVDRYGFMRAITTELTAPLIQTNANPGTDRVVINSAGIRGYDSVYGVTFILPTDGSSPTFANGIIQSATILDTTFISSDFKTSNELPWVEIGDTGVAYRETNSTAQYGSGVQYGDGTKYGVGVTAYYANSAKPILSIEAERTVADVRYYNRSSDASGASVVGDTICVNGVVKLCTSAGTPGTYENLAMSDGTTGGSGSAGSGNQYVELNIGGTTYKILHDGTV